MQKTLFVMGWAAMAATMFLLATTGCGGDDDFSYRLPARKFSSQLALRPVQDCTDLESTVRAARKSRMEEEVNAQRVNALEQLRAIHDDRDSVCYGGCGGLEDFLGMCAEEDSRAFDGNGQAGPPAPSAGTGAGGDGGAKEYSTTNNQVAGVDEADFVKNDGSHIFMVAGGELLILRSWPAIETHVVARVALHGIPQKLFVEGDRALVYSTLGSYRGACGYDDSPTSGGATAATLEVAVFDISDRSAPVLEREILLNGALLAARRIGKTVHTAVTFPQQFFQGFATWPSELPGMWQFCDDDERPTVGELNAAFDRLIASNAEAIDAESVLDYLPSAIDRDVRGDDVVESASLFADCEGFLAPESIMDGGYLSVLSLDLDDDQSLRGATIVGSGGIVYASHQNLYIGVREYLNASDAYESGYYRMEERTLVHKFRIAGEKPVYQASGAVAGRLLNQFAMDEHADFLRLATTEGYLPDPNTTNNVFVLHEERRVVTDEPPVEAGPVESVVEPLERVELAVAGQLRGLAKDEDIRSVRFEGTRGFMVTFKKTDPLFAFDLANPFEPKVLGELKIPGFSTYMHFMDDDHLLTIGFDADDQGSFAWFQGIQLQIFDVTNPAELRLVHKHVIGSRGTTSDATGDHLAFNFMPSRNLLAVPMGICEGGSGGGSYGTTMTFNGLLVFRTTVEAGFEPLGGIDHLDDASNDPYRSSCSNWWQNPDSQVKRSIFMSESAQADETFVYSIAPQTVKVAELGALDAPLASVDLEAGSSTTTMRCAD